MKNLIVGMGIGLSFVLAGCSGKSSTVEAPHADPAAVQVEMKIGGGGEAGSASDAAARKVTAFHAWTVPSMNEKILNPHQSSIIFFDLAVVKSVKLDPQLGDKTPIDLVAVESLDGYPAVTHSFTYADFKPLFSSMMPVGAAFLTASGAKKLMAIDRYSGQYGNMVTNAVLAAVTNDDGLVVYGAFDSHKKDVKFSLLVYDSDGKKVGQDIAFSGTGGSVQGLAVIHMVGPLPRYNLNGWVIVQQAGLPNAKPHAPSNPVFQAIKLYGVGLPMLLPLTATQVGNGTLPTVPQGI
ncbi:hypothetical protein WDW37_01115 [Bdellovibrionota bacterium FG-1]